MTMRESLATIARIERLMGELLTTAKPMRIEPMTAKHAAAVLAIYQAGIDEGNATFETSAPTWDEFSSKWMPEHRFVALDDSEAVAGWVAATPLSDRCAYAGVVERCA